MLDKNLKGCVCLLFVVSLSWCLSIDDDDNDNETTRKQEFIIQNINLTVL